MTLRLSRTIIFFAAVIVLALAGYAAWQRQSVRTMSSMSPTTIASPTPTPPITFPFPIKNTVTKAQMKQFSGSRIGERIVSADTIVSDVHDDTVSTNDFLQFTDGEVLYTVPKFQPIEVNTQNQFLTDDIEHTRTIRIYTQGYYSFPLLRITTSTFETTVEYEKKQFLKSGANVNAITVNNVIAFGHKGTELILEDKVKYREYIKLIVPLNGYVYVFYLLETHDGSPDYTTESSFQFANYPE